MIPWAYLAWLDPTTAITISALRACSLNISIIDIVGFRIPIVHEPKVSSCPINSYGMAVMANWY